LNYVNIAAFMNTKKVTRVDADIVNCITEEKGAINNCKQQSMI